MHLQVRTSTSGAATVVAATGELDLHTAPELGAALDDATQRKVGLLVVDLSGVDFMDSTGLSTIVATVANARAYGGDVRVVVASAKIGKVFTLTGVDKQVGIYADVEQASA